MRTVEGEGSSLASWPYSIEQRSEAASVEAIFAQAGLLHAQGKLHQAEHLYRAILNGDRTHVAALHNLGILCFQCGRYEEAVGLTREVVRLRPDLAAAYNTLA